MFAISLPVLLLAVGGGIDLSRALAYRQQLSNAVDLACAEAALEINHKLKTGTELDDNLSPLIGPIIDEKILASGLPKGVTTTSKAVATVIEINAKRVIPNGLLWRAQYTLISCQCYSKMPLLTG